MRGHMDFDDAIVNHLKWKMYLRNFLEGTGKSLDSALVGSADACELGRWIKGEGKQYEGTAPYRDLVAKHAMFHHVAAEVVKKAEGGNQKGAKSMLAEGREFSSASRDIVDAIMQLAKEVANHRKTTSSTK